MKQTTTLALACLMASVAMCGCQSVGTVARGQSPSLEHPHPSGVHQGLEQAVQDSHLSQAIENHARSAQFDYHNTKTTYNHMVLPANCETGGLDGAICPDGNCRQGYCPDGQCRSGYYPGGICPHHGLCPGGFCKGCGYGNDLNHYPTHHHSWSYSRPQNLTYPSPGQAGGAVVYPYYTHKGPSDFFRKE